MIKVTMEKQELTADGWKTMYATESEVTFERFYKSFVEERWRGEKRLEFKQTPYGWHHTKTIVETAFAGHHERSVRTFDFWYKGELE